MLPSSGTALAVLRGMPELPVADRVTILETKMEKVDSFLENFDTTLEARFRAQAEMLDERFAEVYAKMDQGFDQVHSKMDQGFAQVQTKMDQGFVQVRGSIGALQKDLAILREGMKILLTRIR
jgi:hypothetical protein